MTTAAARDREGRLRSLAAKHASARRRTGLRVVLCCALAAGLPAAGPPPAAQTLPGGSPGSSRTGEAPGRSSPGPGPGAAGKPSGPGGRLQAFLRVAAVGGRGEQAAAAFLRERLSGELPVRTDAAGNLTVTFGSGPPRRLVACPLGETGFVVSRIEDHGYLRLAPAGEPGPAGAPWPQAYEGQVVSAATARGGVPGVVAARSIHLQARTAQAAPPFSMADAFVDVGAGSAAEVAEMGIRPLDPVALEPRPVRLAHDLVAGPGARQKAACLAAADAASRFRIAPGKGTVVFAWTRRDPGSLDQQTGLEHLLRERGPFSELVLLGAARLRPAEAALHPAPVAALGLPALYPGTPVEAVSLADRRQLSSALLAVLGSTARQRPTASSPASPRSAPPPGMGPAEVSVSPPASRRFFPPPGAAPVATSTAPAAAAAALPPPLPPPLAETAALVAELVSRYGVTGDEAAVRQAVAARLPSWAHPTVDWVGNLSVTVGPAADTDPRLFMAHMDEIGFRVTRVLEDGRLELEARGGLLPEIWQAQAALVHGSRGPVPALFEPRATRPDAGRGAPAGGVTAFLGARDPQEVAALGIQVGTTVTMPKALIRLGSHRVTARSLDDRAGCAALLLALRRLDPARLRHRVTFAWTVREEAGLLGAAVLAHRREGWRRVYPVDAFPTSDSPRESGGLAYAPLGRGAVLPATAPRELRDRLLALGRRRGIALQLGMPSGASDGIPFQRGAATVLPIFFPCRYTHSPVEVADLRDLETLADLVAALASAAP
jgi:putative aminopeptidase FrvX